MGTGRVNLMVKWGLSLKSKAYNGDMTLFENI